MVSRSPEVIVIGLGAMGSAALYHLARRGIAVLGIDRFDPPHDRGSSHGETRATRLAVGEGDVYVPLARRSHELWRELEKESSRQLLDQCGFLTIDTTGGASCLHGLFGFYERTVDVARRHGIQHETFDGEELRLRHPAFDAPADARAYFEPEGGLVYPERCISAHLAGARGAGAVIRINERVLAVRSETSGVTVVTDSGEYHAASVVLAAGAWTPELAGASLQSVRLLRQVLHWFEPTDPPLRQRGALPVFLWLHGSRAEDSFYGFPAQPPTGWIKLATEQYSTAISSADQLDRTVTFEEASKFQDEQLQGRILGISPRPRQSKACLYTHAPDAGFIIDRLPTDRRILLVSACSGHGFKHSPAIGEYVALIVVEERKMIPEFLLSKASKDRF